MRWTVSVVNDYEVVVAGVRALLEPFGDRVLVVDTEVGRTCQGVVDVVLFDTFASPMDWKTRVAAMASDPNIGAVAVYSFTTDPEAVADSFSAGAHGFLAKSLPAPELVAGIEAVAAGDRVTLLGGPQQIDRGRWPAENLGLSPREAEMLSLIVQGRSNEEIATLCYLSVNTVKSYIREAYRKIGVTSRPQAVAWGMTNGLRPSIGAPANPSRP